MLQYFVLIHILVNISYFYPFSDPLGLLKVQHWGMKVHHWGMEVHNWGMKVHHWGIEVQHWGIIPIHLGFHRALSNHGNNKMPPETPNVQESGRLLRPREMSFGIVDGLLLGFKMSAGYPFPLLYGLPPLTHRYFSLNQRKFKLSSG